MKLNAPDEELSLRQSIFFFFKSSYLTYQSGQDPENF